MLQKDGRSQQHRAAPDVYFPIEITSREFSGHLLLAVLLASRGLNCVIGFKGAVNRALRGAVEPSILFYKGGSSGWRSSTRHFQVGLDPEAGISYEHYADFLAKRPALADMSRTTLQFCYGKDDYSVLCNRFPSQLEKFHNTGAPRVSLWGTDGDVFYAQQTAQIKDFYGPLILFASSGGFMHPHYKKTLDKANSPWDAVSAGHFLQIAREAAACFPDTSVVIRPHPADNWLAWHTAIQGTPNLFVDSSLDLSAWTRAAAVLVHPGTSTAAFEAVSAGVPVLATASNRKSNVATTISHQLHSELHLLALCNDAFHKRLAIYPSDEAKRLHQAKLYHPLSGAAQRIANVLAETFDFAIPSALNSRRYYRLSIQKPFKRRSSELGASIAPDRKRQELFWDRVQRDVEAAKAVLGLHQSIRLDKIEPNCFLLRPVSG